MELFPFITVKHRVFFPKLSDDKTRFGQNLQKLDPESAQAIFDDLENEVRKYEVPNPNEPLMDSEDFRSPKCTPALAAKIVIFAYAGGNDDFVYFDGSKLFE